MSVICPYCGLELPDTQVITCPRCNQPLKTIPVLDPEEPTLPRLRITKASNPLPVDDTNVKEMVPVVPEAEPEEMVSVVPEAEPEETAPLTYPDPPTYEPPTYEPPTYEPAPLRYPESAAYESPAPAPLLPPPPEPRLSRSEPPIAPVHPVAKRHRAARILVGILLLVVVVAGAGVYYAASHNPVIYQSSLKGSLDNWENGADCAPKSDGYHIRNGSICYAPIDSQADADIKVHVTQLSGSTELFYGIVLRSTPGEHYYLFGIDGNGKWLFVNVPSTSQLPVSLIAPTLDGAIHSGAKEVNALEVKMKGSHFDFFINGTKVGEINDSHYAAGQIGLSGEDGVEVVYTDLSIVKVN